MAEPGSPPFESIAQSTKSANFLRADLHIHSYGVSRDVKDDKMLPSAIIERAVSRGIGMVAITDHNAIDAVEVGIAAGRERGVFVLAGVELTGADGHLLAYFDPDDLEGFRKWFQRLEFQEDAAEDRWLLQPLHTLAEGIQAAGGVAVPAHVGREGTGCLRKAPRKSQDALIASGAVVAIEVDGPDEFNWFDRDHDDGPGHDIRAEQMGARASALGELAGTRMPKLYFSDAHSLEGIGRNRDGEERLTRIKLAEPSFAGFLKALHDPGARIRLEPQLRGPYTRLIGARMIGGFLDGQEIGFSPNLTCLIGGRGAGKSTALEAVRCACLSIPHKREAQEENGWPESVQLVYEDAFGSRHYVERTSGSETVEISDEMATPTRVPIEGYAQDRVAEIIRGYRDDPDLITDFLDRFADLAEVEATLGDLGADLEANRELIGPISSAPARKAAAQRSLDDAKSKLKEIETSHLKEALRYRRLLTQERTLRESIDARLDSVSHEIESLGVEFDRAALTAGASIEDAAAMPGSKFIVGDDEDPGVLPRLADLETALTAWKAEGQRILNETLASITEKRAAWIDYETRVEARIQTIVEELRSKGVTPALAEVNRLAEQEAKAATAIQQADKDINKLGELRKTRKQLLSNYRQAQSKRYYLRAEASKKLTAALNESLKEFKVKITYNEGARVDLYEAWVRRVLGPRAFKADRMTRFCREIHPIDLADALRRKAVKALQDVKDGDSAYFPKESDASEFISLFEAADLHQLEEIAISDLPQISLTTLADDKPRVVPFDNLSHGQKASVLLGALLFADDSTPLIIDQPEDHLDSAFIFETVVQNLRRVKEQRQVILATHNANIAVLGDAELIVPLAGYQGRGVVVDAGSVDSDVTSKRACKVLEGGASAYARRGEMYGLVVSGV